MEKLSDQIPVLLLKWYRQNARILPWRSDPQPYKVWVSEIMLQQTRVEAVKPYFERFIRALPTLQHLAKADEQTLLKLWEGLGYYSRVRNLQKAAQIVMAEYGGVLPCTPQLLIKLPGIGPYTAGAVSSIAYGYRVAAVDGNVLRVIARVAADNRDILSPSVKKDFSDQLTDILPSDCGAFNQALMELGAVICTPGGTPKCAVCPLSLLCKAHAQGQELSFPVKKSKKARSIQQKTVFLFIYDGKAALCKRSDNGLLAGLWGYPMIDDYLAEDEVSPYLEQLGFIFSSIMPLPCAKHIFTHLEWHMVGYMVFLKKPSSETSYIWASSEELKKVYPVPSAYKAFTQQLLRVLDVLPPA